MAPDLDVQEITEDRREMTLEEAEAVLTLVRGGWLRLELNPSDA